MISLKDYITEEEIKPYRFVYLWFDDPDDPDDPESTADDFISEGKKLELKGYKVDVSGAYSDLDSKGKRFIYGKDDDKGFLVDENTIVFVRAPVTRRKSWMDLLTQLERGNVCCVNKSIQDFLLVTGALTKTIVFSSTENPLSSSLPYINLLPFESRSE